MNKFKRKENNQLTNQPTTSHPKMTAADVWASASVLLFFKKVQNQLEASVLSQRDYMTIPKKQQVP